MGFLLSPQGNMKPVQVLAAGEESEPLCLHFKSKKNSFFPPFHDTVQRIMVWKTRLKHAGRVRHCSLFPWLKQTNSARHSLGWTQRKVSRRVVRRRLGCCRMCVSVCECRWVPGHERRLYCHTYAANGL